METSRRPNDEPPRSLRERKKDRTRRTIQAEALRLFAEQGLRHGIVDGLAAFYDKDRDRLLERIKLTFRTPALHPRMRQQQADWAVGVAALLADRLDARPDDLEVRAIAAAVA